MNQTLGHLKCLSIISTKIFQYLDHLLFFQNWKIHLFIAWSDFYIIMNFLFLLNWREGKSENFFLVFRNLIKCQNVLSNISLNKTFITRLLSQIFVIRFIPLTKQNSMTGRGKHESNVFIQPIILRSILIVSKRLTINDRQSGRESGEGVGERAEREKALTFISLVFRKDIRKTSEMMKIFISILR